MEILSFIAEKVGISTATATVGGGLILAVVNLILNKYSVKDKVVAWTNVVVDRFSNWLDSVVSWFGTAMYNVFVALTAFFNRTPLLDKVWEKAVEPIFIIILEMVGRLLTLLFDKLTSIVAAGLDQAIQALKSDNKDFKKKDE